MHIQHILEEHDPQETHEQLQLFNDKLLQIGEGQNTHIMDNIIQIDTEMICETAQQLNPHYFKKSAILTGPTVM